MPINTDPSPEYVRNKEKWQTAIDLYTAEKILAEPKAYLTRRAGIETKDEAVFEERATTATYDPIYGEVVDSLIGANMRYAQDVDDGGGAIRHWNSLGDSNGERTEGTYAQRLWNNADGEGADYLTVCNHAMYNLFFFLEPPVYIEGKKSNDGIVTKMPAIKIFSPLDVPLHFDKELLLKETIVTGSVAEGAVEYDQYRHFTLDGHLIYAPRKGRLVLVERNTEERFQVKDRDGNKVLPWVWGNLALRRNIAYHAAVVAKRMFEDASYITTMFRKISLGDRFVAAAHDPEHAKELQKLTDEGSNFIWEQGDAIGGSRFITPENNGTAADMMEHLRQKKEEYRRNFFASLDAAARPNVTATEIIATHNTGAGAFNAMMAQAMADLETNWLRMIQLRLNLEPDAYVEYDLNRSLESTSDEEFGS